MDNPTPSKKYLSEDLEKLSPFELIAYRTLHEIESSISLDFEPEHAKVLYWRSKGKDYRWIAEHVFGDKITEGRARNLMWEVRKLIKENLLPCEISKLDMVIVSEVLKMMIKDNPDNIDEEWPPPLVDWIEHIKESLKIYGLLHSDKEVEKELGDFVRVIKEELEKRGL
jgi:hypothetical protein